jgi:tyrosine-protein kinase Etk/Wzc
MYQSDTANSLRNEEVNLTKIFFKILLNWQMVLIINIIFISLWYVYYSNATRIYEVQSLIQVDSSNKSYGRNSIEEIFSGGDNTALEEQIEIYKSYSNLEKVIKKHFNNIKINDKNLNTKNEYFGLLQEIYFDIPVDDPVYNFEILPFEEGFEISDGTNTSSSNRYKWDELNILPNGYIRIKKPKNNSNIKFRYVNESITIQELQKKIDITQIATTNFTSTNTLLKISLLGEDPLYVANIINSANAVFMNRSLSENKFEAEQSLEFLQSQLNNIKNRLREKEKLLNKIKSDNASIDIEIEIKALIEKSVSIDEAIKEIDIEIIKSKNLYNSSNPIYQSLVEQRENLISNRELIDEEIQKLPASQQQLVDLSRESQADQLIYEELLQKELEFSLLKASTLGDVKIIDSAHTTTKVSPRGFISLVVFGFLGTLIALSIILLKNTLFAKIVAPSDVEDLIPSIKNIGILNNFDQSDDPSIVDNSISNIVSNIFLIQENRPKDNKVFLFVSGAPGQGKTTLSNLIARNASNRTKKIILIDCDFRKGNHNKKSKKYIDDIYSFYNKDMDLSNFKVDENLWIIPAPRKRDIQSLNIFDSISFKEAIDKFKEEFDYVFIDSPAFLVLPDALVLSRYSDFVIPVIRHENSTVSNIQEVHNKLRTVGKSLDFYIYNAFNPRRLLNYYGYYGYYGDYQNYYYEYKDYYEVEKD